MKKIPVITHVSGSVRAIPHIPNRFVNSIATTKRTAISRNPDMVGNRGLPSACKTLLYIERGTRANMATALTFKSSDALSAVSLS